MGTILVFVAAVAALMFYGTGHTFLFYLAIIVAVGVFWSFGIMHNYATDAARRRADYRGGFHDFTNQEADAVPNWIAYINMAFSILSLALLITGIVFKIQG